MMCGKRSLACLSLLAAPGNAAAAVEPELTQLSLEQLLANEINQRAAREAGLLVSSNLIRLARRIDV